jgi:hypothetical protein
MATAAAFAVGAAVVSAVAVSQAKRKLSRYIAESLSSVLEVDPTAIESNLRSDTKLSLQSVKIKPQYNVIVSDKATAKVEGTLEKIEFSWKWGGSKDGKTNFVRDAALAVRGARLKVTLLSKFDAEAAAAAAADTAVDGDDDMAADNMTMEDETINKHVQQIIDHINVALTDLQLIVSSSAITTTDVDGVALELKSLQLVSLGHEFPYDETPLKQTVSLESLCAYLLSNKDQQQQEEQKPQPILESFHYAATANRVAGRRFMDDFGLHIVGTPLHGTTLTLHAGISQVRSLVRIMDLLTISSSEDPEEEDKEETPFEANKTDLSISVQSAHDKNMVETVIKDPMTYSSLLELPLPAIQVILPNAAVVQFCNLSFCYRTDGTIGTLLKTPTLLSWRIFADFCSAGFFLTHSISKFSSQTTAILQQKGTGGGILVCPNKDDGDEGVYHSLVQLHERNSNDDNDESARCLIDLNENIVSLKTDSDDGHGPDLKQEEEESSKDKVELARLTWQEEVMKPVLIGVREIMKVLDEESDATPKEQETSPSPFTPWTLVADGVIAVRVAGSGDDNVKEEWIEGSLDSPSIVLPDRPDGLPGQISLRGLTLGPSSLAGDSCIQLSSVTLKADSSLLIPVATNIYDFLFRALDFGGW